MRCESLLVNGPSPCELNFRVPPHSLPGVMIVDQARGAHSEGLKTLGQCSVGRGGEGREGRGGGGKGGEGAGREGWEGRGEGEGEGSEN